MQIFQSDILKKFSNLTHAFTTKDGGISKTDYNSLNLAFHVKDDKKNVESNHILLADRLRYKKNSLIHMKQIHSDIVHIVEEDDNFENPPVCDALITDKKNIPLMVMVADCSPILFYDKKKKVIAVAHAGRAGAFKNIVKNVIDCFIDNYNSEIENILVSIGASIGECCYEVGDEIYDEVKKLNIEYCIQKIDNSYHLNIGEILHSQLVTCGIYEKNIEISNECSCCNSDKYFSYRKSSITGRFAGILMLK